MAPSYQCLLNYPWLWLSKTVTYSTAHPPTACAHVARMGQDTVQNANTMVCGLLARAVGTGALLGAFASAGI